MILEAFQIRSGPGGKGRRHTIVTLLTTKAKDKHCSATISSLHST